jgi:hypothetical protein
MPPTRHPLWRITRTLLLGAAITLITAESLSLLASHTRPNRIPALRNLEENVDDGYLIFQTCSQQWPGVEVLSWRYDQYVCGPAWHSTPLLQDPELPSWSSLRDERARRAAETRMPLAIPSADWLAGWPLPALRGRVAPELFTTVQQTQFRDGMLRLPNPKLKIPIGDGPPLTGHFIPLIPLWPGFLIDTLFYSAAWWSTLAALSALRRTMRRRRNHCPHCNYDLHATPRDKPCPECGQIPRRP